MAILTNIVAAAEDEIESLGESLHPVDEWSGIEMRDIDTAKIVTLHCLLTGEPFDDVVAHYEPVYISASEGAIVLHLADEAMQRLAELEDEPLEQVAVELAATEEFETEGWDTDSILAMLDELANLARLAESQDQSLYIWMHPLLT
jgi:hypothetical protein